MHGCALLSCCQSSQQFEQISARRNAVKEKEHKYTNKYCHDKLDKSLCCIQLMKGSLSGSRKQSTHAGALSLFVTERCAKLTDLIAAENGGSGDMEC